MQTRIHPNLEHHPEIDEAEKILRSCVHCGFCTAVCPTYQELGDDLDSPRGRIYLIKDMLEEDSLGAGTEQYLDRCLTCRSCETTCPSGVEYARLLDIGRGMIETRYQPKRPFLRKVQTFGLRFLLTKPQLFAGLYKLGLLVRPILPRFFKNKMPLSRLPPLIQQEATAAEKRVLLLQGCVQRSMTPGVNQSIEYLLAAENVAVKYLRQEGCCGAIDYHLGHQSDGKYRMKQLIDELTDELDQVDWIISSASGCGVTLQDYPKIFKDDAVYAKKTNAIALKLRDVSEMVSAKVHKCQAKHVAVHTPCTLQHGLGLKGRLEEILTDAGAKVVPVAEQHLCCGSSGTYSVLEPELASRLGERKIRVLTEHAPDVIVTGNVGCQTHLAVFGDTPVMHWTEFLAHYPADSVE